MAAKRANAPRVEIVVQGEGRTEVPVTALYLGTNDEDVAAVWRMILQGSRAWTPLCVRRDDGPVLMQAFRPA